MIMKTLLSNSLPCTSPSPRGHVTWPGPADGLRARTGLRMRTALTRVSRQHRPAPPSIQTKKLLAGPGNLGLDGLDGPAELLVTTAFLFLSPAEQQVRTLDVSVFIPTYRTGPQPAFSSTAAQAQASAQDRTCPHHTTHHTGLNEPLGQVCSVPEG